MEIINGIDDNKFLLLFTRILQKFHDKGNEIFNSDERVKLATTLSIKAEDVSLILETLILLLEQITYKLVKPAVLGQQLLQLEFSEDKSAAMVEAWTNNARTLVAKLSKMSLTPSELEDVNWRLNVQLAQGNNTQLNEPIAIFQLGIKNPKNETEKINMEFNHEELFEFYNKLEAIQLQLDALK